MMTKSEIIQATLRAMRQDRGLLASGGIGDDDWDNWEAIVIAEMTERLPDGDLKTCGDFAELSVRCCHTCHSFYPHYEMYMEDLPNGNKAGLCCFVRSSLRGEKAPAQENPEELIDLEVALGGGTRKRKAETLGTR
jgi:hypothetical protein